MGEDPGAIRAEIDQTRARMRDTVDALAYKADVKSRAKESVSEKVDTLKSKVTGARDSVAAATPDPQDVGRGARRAAGIAQENPLGLALGAVAVGFVAGMLLPSTRVEDERIGPVADEIKERAAETGQQALEHGKEVARDVAEKGRQVAGEAVQEVREAAKESGREHGSQVAEDAKQAAAETRDRVATS